MTKAAHPLDAPSHGGGPLIFLIVGEASGDLLGARLMAALKRHTTGNVRFVGLGGPAMAAEGLDSLFPIGDLSVMGLAEIVPRIPLLRRRMRQTARAIQAMRPDAVVSIDVPDFCFGVWRRLGKTDIAKIHYVAPSVWAWRPGRAKRYARHIDHLLALLPFEPPYFEKVGLPCTFVGHSATESGAMRGDGPAFRRRHEINKNAPVLCVLPGSRRGEVSRLLPIFRAAIERLVKDKPQLVCVLPTVSGVADTVREAASAWPTKAIVTEGDGEKFDAMAASSAALAASGTVAVELALARVPMVVAYKVNRVTAALVRRLLHTDHVSLVNILLGRAAIPELLQGDCRPDSLADAVKPLLEDSPARRSQKEALVQAVDTLSTGTTRPSDRAAAAVLGVIEERQQRSSTRS